jgi:ABC-type antimicrobial peptide transport system permease subunit
MAVGARPADVLVQFLGEAALLALSGWAGGAAVALLGGIALAIGTEWQVALPAEAVLGSFLMALATGVGTGALPARKASLLPPIRALAGAG